MSRDSFSQDTSAMELDLEPARERRPSAAHEEADEAEDEPFLPSSAAPPADEDAWSPPVGFVWIQTAIMVNVFLNGFDGTITAATYAVISSEFDAANTASWLTTSYLVTAAAFQPLYGRVSDIFGRRICFFISTTTFAAGCLGCGLAGDVVLLNAMRALTGFGGGGLMTMGLYSHNYYIYMLTQDSDHHQLRHDPLSPSWHVPSHAERHFWLWRHCRRLIWRHYCRLHWLAVVFLAASSHVRHGFCRWLVGPQRPATGFGLCPPLTPRLHRRVEASRHRWLPSSGNCHLHPAPRAVSWRQRTALV